MYKLCIHVLCTSMCGSTVLMLTFKTSSTGKGLEWTRILLEHTRENEYATFEKLAEYTYTSYWGEPERAPYKRYFNARSVYIIMVRPSPVRRFVDSVLGPHAMFSAVKSAWSKQLRHSAIASVGLFAILLSWSAS